MVGFVYKKAWNHCLNEMHEKFQRYGVSRVAFETNKHGDQPIEVLQGLFRGIGVVGFRNLDNKHSRIMNAGTFAHCIHLAKDSDKTYTEHVVKYEYKAKYDDAPDSLASCLKWVGLLRGRK